MSAPYTARAREGFAARLQTALTVEDVEHAYLRGALDVVPARSTGFYRLDIADGHPIGVTTDAPEGFLSEYEQYGRVNDPVLQQVISRLRPVDSSRAVGRATWDASPVREILARAGWYHSMEAPVVASGIICGTINFARGDSDATFSRADLNNARLISEQLGLALERAQRYEELGTKSSRFEDALDRLPQAVVVTDLDAQILFSNRAARRPTFDGGPSMAQLAQTRIVETMEVFRRDRARVSTSSVPDSVGGGPLIVKSVRLADHNEASLTVIYSGAEDTPTRRLPAWAVLSVREQEIADLVSQGLTTKQIAQQAFITENTVKKHLQRIFAKTDTRNRAELVQRIWAHAGAGHST